MHKLFCAKLANCNQPKIVSKSLFPPYRKDRRGRTFCKNAPAFSSNQPTLQNLKYLNPLDPRFPPLLVSSHLCSSSPLRRASASSLWSLPPRSSTSPLAALQLPSLVLRSPSRRIRWRRGQLRWQRGRILWWRAGWWRRGRI